MTLRTRPWRRLINTAAEEGGSIHDNEQAKELGFKGAFVPGTVVASAAIPLIVERFGSAWMEGGWFSFDFRSPVYDTDEVQATAEEDDGLLSLSVANRDERVSCAGRAGLGFSKPWAGEEPEWGDVFPDLPRGFSFPEKDVCIRYEDVAKMLEASGDDTPWYREASPWGDPIAPPEWLFAMALRTKADTKLPIGEVTGPGIWARHQLAIREPLRYDTGYQFRQCLAGKGSSERTYFFDYEFEVREGGRQLVIGRHRGKLLKESVQI